MAQEKVEGSVCCQNKRGMGSVGGGIYGLAFIGALIYFLQHAETFWMGVLAILKAIVWPALLVYQILDFLKM
jgi:hypothetical protein